MEMFENKEICKNCGGKCCIKSGCDYFVNDLAYIFTDEYNRAKNRVNPALKVLK